MTVWRDRLFMAAAAALLVVLPLDVQPLRFEAHETQRAGVLAIVGVLALLAGFRAPPKSPLRWAILAWCATAILATVFALSPVRAAAGDFIRRMGLVTQLLLVGVALIGARLDARDIGRAFGWVGLIVAVHTLMQAVGFAGISGVGSAERPAGMFGLSTYTGGWLALAILWAGVSVVRDIGRKSAAEDLPVLTLPQPSPNSAGGYLPSDQRVATLRRVVTMSRPYPIYFIRMGGIGVMLLALVVIGSRGATLALFAGALMIGLLWTRTQGRRWLALALLALPLAGMLALGVNWSSTPLASVTLLTRLNHLDDRSTDFRLAVWGNALDIVNTYPALTGIDTAQDRWYRVRPLVGYGWESFETAHEATLDYSVFHGVYDDRPTDRAHNDWLDILVAAGWLGLAARLALWLGALGWGLRRMGIGGRWVWLGLVAGALAGGGIARMSPWLPAALTSGGIVGIWCGLAAETWFGAKREKVDFDLNSALALGVLTAQVIDLQFNFSTIAVAVPMWLAMGVLLARRDALGAPLALNISPLWAGIAGALLVRAQLANGGALLLLLGGVLIATRLYTPISRRDGLAILVGWAAGWLGAQITSPEWAAVWDVGFLAAAVLALAWGSRRVTENRTPQPALRQQTGGEAAHDRLDLPHRENSPIPRTRVPPRFALAGVVMLALLVGWGADIAADIHLKRGIGVSSGAESGADRAIDLRAAARLRPWDDGLVDSVGENLFAQGYQSPASPDTRLMVEAETDLQQAARLNPYSFEYAHWLAIIDELLGFNTTDSAAQQELFQRADGYFAAAAALYPNNAALWREWARFALDVLRDPPTAYQHMQRAMAIAPEDDTLELLTRIQQALRQ